MQEQKKQEKGAAAEEPTIPRGQRVFDNMFLWLILSFLISGLIYNAWGLIEVFSIPRLLKAVGG